MSQPFIISRHEAGIAAKLLGVFVLIAAVVNVPWALTFMRSRLSIGTVPLVSMDAAQMPREWPSATPHQTPWPAPNYWWEGRVFGCRRFDVRAVDYAHLDRNSFTMDVQQIGWPFPVIEQKQMWWDFDDPKTVFQVKLTPEQKRMILSENAKRVYGLP